MSDTEQLFELGCLATGVVCRVRFLTGRYRNCGTEREEKEMQPEEVMLLMRGMDCPTSHRATVEVFDCARERALQALEVMTEIAGLRGSEAMSIDGADYFVDVLESYPDGLRSALLDLRDSVRV